MPDTAFTFFRYLPVNDTDKRWGLYATTVGTSCCSPGAPYPPGKHPETYDLFWERGRILGDFQVVYLTRGEGVFESAKGGTEKLQPGAAFLLFPGEWHRYRPDSLVGWNEHWVGFDGDLAHQLLQRGLISPGAPIVNIGIDQELMAAFARAVEVVKRESPGFQQTLAGLVLEILGRVGAAQQLKRVKEIQPNAHSSVIQEAKLYLAERLEEPIDLHALANHLAVSYSGLRRAFKVHTGFSPHQYQLELRLGEAKTLLANTVQPVKRIAYRLGFQNPYYFSRFFRKRTGLSPEQWRHEAHGGDHPGGLKRDQNGEAS